MQIPEEIATYPVENHVRPKRKRRYLKRLFSVILVLGLAMTLASLMVSTFFGEKINRFIMDELNAQFKSDISVNEFSLNIWKSFPNISAELKDVKIPDTQGGNLIESKLISFRFGLLGLLRSEVEIKKVVAIDGAIYIYLDTKGNPNYHVFREKKSRSERSEFKLDVKAALLKDFEFIYINKASKQEMRTLMNTASFSGNFDSNKFSMKSIADLESDFFEIDGRRYIKGQSIQYDALLDVDLKNRVYDFQKALAVIDGNQFDLNGKMAIKNKKTEYDLELKSKKGNLKSVLAFLPEEYLEKFKGLESTGIFQFEMFITGEQSVDRNPQLEADIFLKRGTIESPLFHKPFKEVSFNASFSNGKKRNSQTSILEISKLKGYFDRDLTELEMKLSNFKDPRIALELNGKVPLRTIQEYIKKDEIQEADGVIVVQKLKLEGDLKDMKSMRNIAKVKTSGSFMFKELSFNYEKEKIEIGEGTLLLKSNKVIAKDLKINGMQSDIELSGNFENLIPVLISDSSNSKNAKLDFVANINSDKLNVKKILSTFQVAEKSNSKKEDCWHNRLSGFLNGALKAKVKEITYGKIEGKDFEGKLIFEDEGIFVDGDVETMEGSMSLEGEIQVDEKPKMFANLSCDDINIYEFFRQADNFGQDVIVADNLKGAMNSNISIKAYWDEKGDFLSKKLKVLAKLNIKHGELNNFKLLEDFANYINIKDLRQIKFNELQNWLEIRDGKIRIPTMFIQNNAVNLTVSGSHGFDHFLDYNIRLNAGQVLINRMKKHDPSLKPQKAKTSGFNLHYVIRGPMDNYKFRKDRKTVLQKFKLSELVKKRIKKALEKEFGGELVKAKNIAEFDEKLNKKEEKEMKADLEKEVEKLVEEEKKLEKEDEAEGELVIPEYDESAVGEDPDYLWEKKRGGK